MIGGFANLRDGFWSYRAFLPMRIGAISADEPGGRLGKFLQAVLGPVGGGSGGGEVGGEDRARWLRRLDGRAFPREAVWAREPDGMLVRDVQSRLQEANLRESRQWEGLKTRTDWEQFREPRLRALRDSLGLPPTNAEQPPRVP